jgi:hypothetical protein
MKYIVVNFVKFVILILTMISFIAMWFGPIVIALITGNWWLVLLYTVWWIPALLWAFVCKGIIHLL